MWVDWYEVLKMWWWRVGKCYENENYQQPYNFYHLIELLVMKSQVMQAMQASVVEKAPEMTTMKVERRTKRNAASSLK